jgi:hypothetical protein
MGEIMDDESKFDGGPGWGFGRGLENQINGPTMVPLL